MPPRPPFRRSPVLRHDAEHPRRYAVEEHPSDVCAPVNLPFDLKPLEGDEHLRRLLVD